MASPIETPSGKDADYENFPVGSVLIAKPLRRHVADFYAFARACDDIADNPDLTPVEKVERLDGFESALMGNATPGFEKAERLAESLAQTSVTPRHALGLLAAFKQDAIKARYKNWPDLIAYCRLSAAPVGRFMIDLHGGSRRGYGASDALCIALQLINHLQDCGEDYRTLDRVYLPQDWLAEAGADIEGLAGKSASGALRQVFDWTLLGVNQLLADAESLPGGLYSSRLALESAVIIRIAQALSRRLGKGDPLANRIELSKSELALCSLQGIMAGALARW